MKGRNMQIFSKQRGAVSLFIVIFTMLLMTVVTISFIRIMLQDQQQASNLDLSQSAYDSAQAGVEDAKRAILQYQSICAADTSVAQTDCKAAEARVGSQTCNQGLSGIQTVGTGEVKVQQTQSTGDAALDQAYTCVTVQLQTPDYLGSLEANASKVIPLIVPDGRTFNTVTLKWFTQQDLGSTNTFAVDLLPSGSTIFPLAGNWPTNRPSLMRAQLIQLGSSFTLANLDASSTTESDANTLFLYPTATPANTSKLFNTDPHTLPKSTGVGPQAVTCLSSLTAGGYACSVTITLPRPFGATANSNGTIPRTAYLRVSGFFNKTNYSVSLAQGATAVPFDAVQPQVDSTGRANDLFRRVQSRIDIVDPAYPDAAVDITGGFCKNFTITDNTADYSAPNTCTP
jgi:Tfp pilus assembly protein PilX